MRMLESSAVMAEHLKGFVAKCHLSLVIGENAGIGTNIISAAWWTLAFEPAMSPELSKEFCNVRRAISTGFPATSRNLPVARRKHICSANDNDAMDEFNADRLKATLDLFILKRFSDDGPLSLFEIQRRAKPIHTLLELLAVRKGKQSLGSLPAALQRLHRDGWLKVEPKTDEGAESELVYSLTVVGEQRVEEESARLESMLSQFVEQGDMEKSFRKFLNQRKPEGNN
jgi:DNA-binding PadR family transcriptional regulator